jgi:acyl-CoA thioesterase-1
MAGLLAAGCGRSESGRDAGDAARPVATPDARGVVLCVGTSLTAGYGLDPQQAWPALVQQQVDKAGLPLRLVNAGVSGETSAGALGRIDWLLRQKPRVLLLETGANDALRGQDLGALRANLEAILARAKSSSPPPVLVLFAMEVPPNYGAAYQAELRALYPEVARAAGVTLMPFFLDGVAGHPELNLPDGIHPNAEGHRRIADNVWRHLGPLLREATR